MGQRGEREIVMSGMGDVIVSLEVREEKDKCKKMPTGLEEGETIQEELGDKVSLESRVVLGFWLSQHSG